MNLYEFVKIIHSNLRVVLLVPVVLAGAVFGLTLNLPQEYSAFSTIYTGVASGYNLENGVGVGDRFRTQTVFDNVLMVMKSNDVLENTSLKLLAQHLMQEEPSPRILSEASFEHLNTVISAETRQAVVDASSHAKTVENLRFYMNQNEANEVYLLVNSGDPHYGRSMVASVAVSRVKTSDIVKLDLTLDDPGIVSNTLAFYGESFIEKYKGIKVGETNDIVEYFQREVERTLANLNQIEERLLQFREDNNILDYVEQVRAIALKKEDMEAEMQAERMKLASAESAVKYVEDELAVHSDVLVKNDSLLRKRALLEKLSGELALRKTFDGQTADTTTLGNRIALLKSSMRDDLSQVYALSYSTSGVSTRELLNRWFESIIAVGQANARLRVFDGWKNDFTNTYKQFAPMGSNLNKIDRELEIAEQEYLRMVESLNLAQLRKQNMSLSTDLKVVDAPAFPSYPNPSKRWMLVALAGILGLVLTIVVLVVLEMSDTSVRTPERFAAATGLSLAAAWPVFKRKMRRIDVPAVKQLLSAKLFEDIRLRAGDCAKPVQVAFFSPRSNEGRTAVLLETALAAHKRGFSVLAMVPEGTQAESELPAEAVQQYALDNDFFLADSFAASLGLTDGALAGYDFVLVEVPALLTNEMPAAIAAQVHQSVLITRANRTWNQADTKALEHWTELAPAAPIGFLNGIKLHLLDVVLGEVPIKRSKLRKLINKLLRFDFGNRAF